MPPGISAGLGGYVAPTVQPSGGISSSNVSPAVITSSAAQNNLNNIQTQHTQISQGITDQATNVAGQKSEAAAAAQTAADKAITDKAAAEKSDLEHKQANIKMAAITGQSPNPTTVSTSPNASITSDTPYGGGTNGVNGWRQVTLSDGTSQVVQKSADGTYVPVKQDQIDLQSTKDQLAQTNADYNAKALAVSKTISDIANGVIPLNAGEQAQVQGLQSSFQQLINQQTLANTAATGAANLRGYQKGAAEYDPNFQVSTIGSIVTAGINKVADLNIKMASEVAKLTQSFHDDDIKAIQDSWNVYQSAAKDRQTTLQKTIDDAQAVVKNAQDEADKTRTYNLDVQKFQETKDKDAFDNAFKTEQNRISEEKNKLQFGTNNILSGLTASGGAKLNTDGTVDKNSQKTVVDNIAAQYGLATATALQAIANYQGNLSDFTVRSGTGMNRSTALGIAKLINPSFDQTQYLSRQALRTNFASGQYSRNINSLNTTIGHLASLATNSNLLPNGDFTKFNTVKDYLANTFGAGSVTKVQTDLTAISSELAATLKGAGATDQEIGAIKKGIDINASPEQFKSFVEEATTLLDSRLNSLNETYTSGMGQPPDAPFLHDTANQELNTLKRGGYDMNISGIRPDAVSKINDFVNVSKENFDHYNTLKTQYPNATPEQISQALGI